MTRSPACGLVAAIVFVVVPLVCAQAPGTLHVSVALLDADGRSVPVPHHALLISDNPATAAPRRVETTANGTVDVRLRPGNYTVESDAPVAFQGRAYHWAQNVDVTAGGAVALEFTVRNAEVDAVTADAAALAIDPLVNLMPWQDSVVALWTATTRASGFVIDGKGLIATNQEVVGTATSVEVQFGPAIKVAGRVLAADRVRDVAIVWVDPTAVASVRPVAVGCGTTSPIVQGQKVFAIGMPLDEPAAITSGNVTRIDGHNAVSDVVLGPGGAGGPVFTADNTLVGITTDADEDNRHRESGIVAATRICDVVASAEKKMAGRTPPPGIHLPVEPAKRSVTAAPPKEGASNVALALNVYQMSSTDFAITFITPPLLASANNRAPQGSARAPDPLADFGNWSDYVANAPPVLLVRVTPRLVEGFWTTVARGAARTQGVALPPIKHFTSGFSRMRALCGETEVTPIHPFTIEQRVSETDAIREGLYVFDPAALRQCPAVKLVLYSEKAPEKGDTRIVDPALLQRIAGDFASGR